MTAHGKQGRTHHVLGPVLTAGTKGPGREEPLKQKGGAGAAEREADETGRGLCTGVTGHGVY